MITSISGTLVSATPLSAVIENGGLGYEVHIPVTTAERLPPPGRQAKLHTLAEQSAGGRYWQVDQAA